MRSHERLKAYEQWALDFGGDPTPGLDDDIVVGYMAGFRKAKELSAGLVEALNPKNTGLPVLIRAIGEARENV